MNKFAKVFEIDPTKFFGCELGAQTTFDDKGDRYIVNGAHDLVRLRELLDSFIEKFVLCPSCKNPETELIISGKKGQEMITKDCKACGHKGQVDMKHKLCTFILKNPPPKAGVYGEKFGKKGGKSGKKDKGEKEGSEEGSENGEGEGGDKVENAAEKAEEKKEVIAGKEFDIPDIEELKKNVDDDWKVDTSKEAVEARMKQLGVDMKQSSLNDGDDEDGGEGGVWDEFGNWVKENREGVRYVFPRKDCFDGSRSRLTFQFTVMWRSIKRRRNWESLRGARR
jgi:translation initiation factor 5